MVNRYITALLVVLAATGMEAHTYESALRLALSDISYEQVCLQPEAKALEEDILAVIKAIKQASEENFRDTEPAFACVMPKDSCMCDYLSEKNNYFCDNKSYTMRFWESNIIIRGPDYL